MREQTWAEIVSIMNQYLDPPYNRQDEKYSDFEKIQDEEEEEVED